MDLLATNWMRQRAPAGLFDRRYLDFVGLSAPRSRGG
jgi:hypothetical protein